MRRREFITLLGGAAVAWPLAARAQQRERMRRIGVLCQHGRGRSGSTGPHRGVPAGTAAIGLDRRPQRADRHPLGPRRCRAHSQATQRNWLRSRRTSSWPLAPRSWGRCCRRPAPCRSCSCRSTDPVGAGFVASLARPGGNATGFLSFEYGISGKWLELLKQIAPRVTRAAVLRDPAIAAGIGQLAAIQSVAPSLGVELSPINVRDAGEIERAITAFARGSNGGLIVTAERAGSHSSRTDHRAGGPAPTARGLPLPLLRHRRRPDLLWARSDRPVPARGRLRRPHPQGREARRPSGAGADQVRDGDQPQDRQGARPRRAADAARPRRRGDRMRRRAQVPLCPARAVKLAQK